MVKQQNQYDGIATYYSRLSQIVFGKSIQNAQFEYIDSLSDGKKVLILGGGSGEFLVKLLEKHPHSQITYLDSSDKMIELSKARLNQSQLEQVQFICDTFQSYSTKVDFDYICCFFFLDLFKPENLKKSILKIHSILKSDGTLLVADFNQAHKIWQKIIEKCMFFFLRLTTKIEANQIEYIHKELVSSGFQKQASKSFYKRFIFSSTYQKST